MPVTSTSISFSSDATALSFGKTSSPSNRPIEKSTPLPQNSSSASPSVHRSTTAHPGVSGLGSNLNDTFAFDYEDRVGRPQVSSVDAFRERLQALPKSSEAPPSTTFLKPKPVKKVRVQSPPPSLPSSVDSDKADFIARFPPHVEAADGAAGASGPTPSFDYAVRGGLLDDRPVRNYADYSIDESSDSDDDGGYDKKNSQNTDPSPATTTPTSFLAPQQTRATVPAPSNPFQKTYDDFGREAQISDETTPELAARSSTAKASMDVDAFRRLLLTGQGPVPMATRLAAVDAVNNTDASSFSKHLALEVTPTTQEATPRTSHEISETDDDRSGLIHGAPPAAIPSQRQILRKKPPPPSSRHGKLIKAQPEKKDAKPANEAEFEDETAPPLSPPVSDTNKPLPPPPVYPSTRDDTMADSDGELDSQIDAAPTSEPAPPLAFSPPATQTPLSSSQPKKPTPAPPPRRQAHNRSDSRSNLRDRPAPHVLLNGDSSAGSRTRSPVGSPRSSFDSATSRSRSSSLAKAAANASATSPPANASANIPAPPPPRRVNHAPRPSTATVPVAGPQSYPLDVSDSERTTPRPSPATIWQNGGTSAPSVSESTPNLLPPMLVNNSGTSTTPLPIPSRLAKPPPPPTRNTSVRHKDVRPGALGAVATERSNSGSSGRPASIASVDAVSRRIGGSQMAPPPPPPTRQRGGSRGSMDAPAHSASLSTIAFSTPRQVSSESVRLSMAPAAQNLVSADEGGEPSDNGEMASHILADLDALRREVDALRGQFKADP